MSLSAVSFFNFKPASWSHDWTQQELAEFYRVEASLIRANIPIDTDRGRSDEGDPWFVFCNANTGEIIVHFARFDGTYLVASPALGSCARGRDFRALIEAQIASHPLVIPKSASGKLFIHPAALLIVLVATYFFKLSQTTAAAGELHEAQPAHPGVESLNHSDSESQVVMLGERATATLLAAIATAVAWAQSHDFNLWSIGAALPTTIDVPSQDLSGSTFSAVASPVFDQRTLFYVHGPTTLHDLPLANTGGGPSATLPRYHLLTGPNDHSAAYQTFTSFDTTTLAEGQTPPATSGPLSSGAALSPLGYDIKTAIMPIGGSTVSSQTTDAAVNSETIDTAQGTSSVGGTPISGVQNVSGVQNAPVVGATPTGSIFLIGGATTTFVLTAGNDSNTSLGHSDAFAASDLISGVIDVTSIGALGGASTLNAGDALVLSGATLSIVDIQHPATTNELSNVSLTGPFQFGVHELATDGGFFDFMLASGATNVESLNSTSDVTFTHLAVGTNAEISGSATLTGTIVNVTYTSPATAESFQVDGGVSGVSFETPATYKDDPTSETILSTGAANGTGANPDWFHITNNARSVTSLTVNATTSLVAGLWNLDFNDTAGATTLTVSGRAALVDLTPGGDDTFSIVSASGLTTGALHICASNDLTTFAGGCGGGNELLYNGETLDSLATAIDGGGGTGNILSAQLANASNGGIFTNWQTLDITNYGGMPFDANLLTNDPIMGVQFSGADGTAETVRNLAPAATATLMGTDFTDAGLTITHSSATGDSLAVTLNNADSTTSLSTLWLDNLTSRGDATISIASTGAAGSISSSGYNGIGTLTETDGHLTTLTVTGNNYTYVGYASGVQTDIATTSTANITSALAKIDASATTGGVAVYGGNSTLDGSCFEVSYKGLTLDGGSGAGDVLYNGAADGATVDLDGKGDAVWLGGSDASGTLGAGSSDSANVGYSLYTSAVTPAGPETVGAALGDTVGFGAGATATLKIYQGGEWDGATFVGGNPSNGVGETIVDGAVAGLKIDLSGIAGTSGTIQNQQSAVGGAPNLTTAENDAVAALGAVGVAYFTFGGNEYLVAARATETGVSLGDAVVELHAVNFTGLSMSGGVVHVA